MLILKRIFLITGLVLIHQQVMSQMTTYLLQDFNSSSVVSNYVSATPNLGQFNAISSSGAGMVVSITNGKLQFARTGNAGSFSRTTDFSPQPTALIYQFKLNVTGNTVAQTSAAVFQIGSNFGTANSAESNANTFARLALNFTASDGEFALRDITGSSNGSVLSGEQTITWVVCKTAPGVDFVGPDGIVRTLDANKAYVWANSTLIFNGVNVQTSTQSLTDLKFAFTAGTGTITIDDIHITDISSHIVSNSSGWRMMSGFTNVTYAQLFAPVWLQGMDNITGNGSTGFGQPNLMTFNESSGFQNVTDAGSSISAGQGFIYYHFNDDNYDGSPNGAPTNLGISGSAFASATVNLAFTDDSRDAADKGWNLIGNPFGSNINAFGLIDGNTNIDQVIYVYDHNYASPSSPDVAATPVGAYRVWNGTTGSLSGGRIAPFQAFFVKTSAPVANFEITSAAKTTNSATFYREANTSASVQLRAVSGNMMSDSWISLTSDGSVDLDSRDAFKLAPLDLRPYMSLATSAEGRMLDINNLPADLTSIAELPLHVELFDVQSNAWTPSSGNVTLTWPEIRNFPSDWVLELVDARTGATVNMLSETSFEFEVQPALRKSAPREPRMTPSVQSADGSTALFLRVGPATSTSVQTGGVDVPLVTELYGNYPNPFNPTTRIQYALPFASHVRLEVFDLMGRRVALLVDGEQRAGSQFVNFDAASLSSGVYVYRLAAAGQTITRKMTLVK
jgi:hypothetical protein